MNTDLKPYISRYEDTLLNNVIPFWENHCPDKKYGGYFTSLDRDGSVYDSIKYMWMQWRIVYMFALLYKTRYGKESWLELAKSGFDFLRSHGKSPNGFYYFALTREGEPAMAPYNIYSECFTAMGSAALYKATGEAIYKEEAESAMKNFIFRMDCPKGKWEKRLPGLPARLSLGHYMMLANLGAVMSECLGSSHYEEQCNRAVATVMNKFYNPCLKVLFENINTDGSFDFDSCEGRFINPGHGLESLWFILNIAEKNNDQETIKKACDYIDDTFRFGMDKTYGGIFYFMDAQGKPHLELQHDMKLWWVHNEATLAALYAYRLSGEEKFLSYFKEIDAWSFAHFPDPEYGEWFAYLNRRGEPTHLLKGGKWKTFFHLPRCLLFAIEQMEKIEAR